MTASQRFERTLALGLVVSSLFIAYLVCTPHLAYSVVGGSGAHLSLQNLQIGSIGLYPGGTEGQETTQFSIGSLSGQSFVLEQQVSSGSVAPGASDMTLKIEAPAVDLPGQLDLYTSSACVDGVGLGPAGLLSGLLDGFINPSIDEGFDPTIVTALLNLIGPTGLIPLSISTFDAQVVQLQASQFNASSGMTVIMSPGGAGAGGC